MQLPPDQWVTVIMQHVDFHVFGQLLSQCQSQIFTSRLISVSTGTVHETEEFHFFLASSDISAAWLDSAPCSLNDE